MIQGNAMGNRSTLSGLIVTCLMMTGLCAAVGLGQEKAQAEELQYEVAVTLKLIQVYVLDKKGKPVTDLNMSDFSILDSGQVQTLTEFEKHLLSVVPIEGQEQAEPSAEDSPQLTRKFFFLFDLGRMQVNGFNESKKAALHFLDSQVRSTDQVGIMVFSRMRGIALHEYLNDDHAQVREIISSMNEMLWSGDIDRFNRQTRSSGDLSLSGQRDEGEAEMGVRDGLSARSYTALPVSIRTERNPEEDARELKDFDFIEEMEELAKAMGSIPGYKNVVLFSEGFPRRLYQGDTFIQKNINEMAKEFATASSPIHTVNTDGGRHFYKSADERGDSMLRNLSKRSGGKYFGDVKRYEDISQELHTMTGNYYVLGYYTGEAADGKYHEIQVKVKRDGCRVIAQQGYLNPKPFPKLSRFEKQLRLFDLAMSDEPQFQEPKYFSAVALPFAAEDEPNLVLFSQITKEDLPEVMEGKVEIVTLIYEEHNIVMDSQRRELGAGAQDAPELFAYAVSSLPPGEYSCRMVIRNLESGRGAVAAAEVEIPEAREREVRLYPPLLFLPDHPSILIPLQESSDPKDKGTPLMSSIYPLLPGEFTPLMGALQPGARKIGAALRLSAAGTEWDVSGLTAKLTQEGSSQVTIPIGFSVLETGKEGGIDVLLAELDLPDLEPGDYILEVTLVDPSGGTQSSVARPLAVRSDK